MHYLELTCATSALDLALDEALLEQAENAADEAADDVLRIWEMRRPTVVVGRSSQLAAEVDAAECRRRGVEVLRRTSGGAAIVAGPGCLMYSVVLSYGRHPQLRAVDRAHAFVLGRVLEAVRPLEPRAQCCGTSDLAVEGRKFSGNSLRCRRNHLLYHGTLLYDFPLEQIGSCLRMPPRRPEYRGDRSHREFVGNLPLSREALTAGLKAAWQADTSPPEIPEALIARLASEKFLRAEWNERLG